MGKFKKVGDRACSCLCPSVTRAGPMLRKRMCVRVSCWNYKLNPTSVTLKD